MTRLHIVHETTYRYATPVTFGTHRLVLRPHEGHDLTIEQLELRVSPRHSVRFSRDLFGNTIGWLTLLEPSGVLSIRSEVSISRRAWTAVVLADLPAEDYPIAYDPLELGVAAVYCDLSYPRDAGVLQTWLDVSLRIPPRGNTLSILEQLNREIFERYAYRRRDEKGVQSPGETLSCGSGSCRDKATLFMEAARALGIAARFASGYLDCAASLAGRASTHAWAEVYLPQSGWVGFDPTIGETTSSKHVAIGVSHHPRGVMPISGLYTGARSQFLGMEVRVLIEPGQIAESRGGLCDG